MKALALLLISLALYAKDLDSLIQTAYQTNPTIQKLTQQIELKNFDIANAQLYKNPIVTLGLNDINLQEPIKRDLEAMQTEYINISQEITDSNKLQLNKQIEQLNKKVALLFLEEQKDRLKTTLFTYYFQYEQLTKQIQLNEQKIDNIEKISTYYTNHIQNKKAFQEILNNDLTTDKLKLQILLDTEKQKQILINISELVGEKVENLSLKDYQISSNVPSSLEEHRLLLIENQNILIQKKQERLATENLSSDYTISAGYYHRSEFDDYLNISIKFPLTFYGKEKNEVLKAKKQIHIAHSKYNEIKNTLIRKQQLELSKQKLAKSSLSYIDKIQKHLEKEKELISKKNSLDSLIEILLLENMILDNDIARAKYVQEIKSSNLELLYLSSDLQRL